ncbi:MAG: Tn3 family transposase, partial [Bacteroidales bacterium]|nr:Tn3 family transposase [Bacteroidales bacterium]
MSRRQILTETERNDLFAIPEEREDLIRLYSLSERDISMIDQKSRGNENRLGIAIQLCYMRFPGIILPVGQQPSLRLLNFISDQLNIDPQVWSSYSERSATRREHILSLRSILGVEVFSTANHYESAVDSLQKTALQTDKGIILANELIENLRFKKILLPAIFTIENICAEAITRASRHIYKILTDPLTNQQKGKLDSLLSVREGTGSSTLLWLRQSPAANKVKHILEHIERLNTIKDLDLPADLEKRVHQNRLLKIAREGGQMTAQHLGDFEATRRYATIVAVVIEAKATLIDEIVDLHDHIMGSIFNSAKNTHENEFKRSGKAINDKVRLYCRIGNALVEAKQTGEDPFSLIESIITWDEFTKSITEAEHLSQPESFDYYNLVGNSYSQIRRYIPTFLEAIELNAAPAAKDILVAVDVIKTPDYTKTRIIPRDVPTSFVRKRWEDLVFTEEGIDHRNFEFCLFSELKNALRSGDVWVKGSRQFKDFEEYLLSVDKFKTLKEVEKIPLNIDIDCDTYLNKRLSVLHLLLEKVDRMAQNGELIDVSITEEGLKISPITNSVPIEAEAFLTRVYSYLPRVKITDLLMEVDSWTDFTEHFTHLKSAEPTSNKTLLLTAILSDAINLGLRKMAESTPGITYAKLTWLQAWHIRDETYSSALSVLVNAQLKHPFAGNWGEGTTSSSDGQEFKSGGHAKVMGSVNPKHGSEPGLQYYTHVNDQYIPFHTKVINSGVRDATYVLDGLLYHESDLRIEEHYTDTSGFTDHVFALMHLLGFRFAPRIRDLKDTKLFISGSSSDYPALSPLIGGKYNLNHIRSNWNDILRLGASIKQGVVTASLIVRKIGSYPRQNGLALALRELGRIERTIFILKWYIDPQFRQHVTAELNKGESRNALSRAVSFNRLGEIRDKNYEDQRYRASGLTLVTAAIVLWNTVYLDRIVTAMKEHGHKVDDNLLQYLSPLGWEHINLTGDYVWQQNKQYK